MEYRIVTVRRLNRVTLVYQDETHVVMTEQPIYTRDTSTPVYATFRATMSEQRTSVRFHVKLQEDRGGYADADIGTVPLIRAAKAGGAELIRFLWDAYVAATGDAS